MDLPPSGFHAYNCPALRTSSECVGCDIYPIWKCRILEKGDGLQWVSETEVLMVAVPAEDGQFRMPPLPFSFTLLSCELAYMRPGDNCGYTIDWPLARIMREGNAVDRFAALKFRNEMDRDLIRAEVETMDWPETIDA